MSDASPNESITPEGIVALRAELEELEGPRRTEMAARIKTARELGDLKENADYHIAKDDQGHLEARIRRLRERLRRATVVEAADAPAGSFAFGRTAEVLDESTGKRSIWTLVGSTEANLAAGQALDRISGRTRAARHGRRRRGRGRDPSRREGLPRGEADRLAMASAWPSLSYEAWSATCDTLHAHTQVLGKLAVELAPPEPQLQHAALRLTPRGWETNVLPAPNGSGTLAAGLDLRTHEAFVEHSGGGETRIALTPNRPVAEVTREVLEAVERLAGPVAINPTPQEVPWEVPLDEDREHATYDPDSVATYFTAATQAALVLGCVQVLLSGPLDAGERLVGDLRPGGRALLGQAGRATRPGLHLAQRRGRGADRDRLVARRPQLRRSRLLRLRASGGGGFCQRGTRSRARPLGSRPR